MVSKRQRYFYRPVYKAVIKPTAYCLLSPLIIAVVLVECCIPSSYRRRRRGRRDRARQELLGRVDAKYAPQPLVPEERLRPLTRCTNEDPYNPQPASPFFKLPAELRLRIYREALGDNVIHLLLKPYRVGHVVCPDAHVPAEKDPARSCFLPGLSSNKIREYDRWLHRTHDQDSCKDLKSCSLPGHALPQTTVCLAFLLTCRRVYCEAIDILYSDNVFDVSHPQTLALFASTVLPERLALIQSLHVSWTQSSDYGQHWPRLWAEVTTKERMPALKHVSLSVQRSYRINDLQQEAIVAPIIEYLRGVDSFDISYMPADSLDVSRDSPDIRQWSELGERILWSKSNVGCFLDIHHPSVHKAFLKPVLIVSCHHLPLFGSI